MSGAKRGKYYTHVEPKLLLVEAWARDGMIEEDIARKLGIAYSTFKVYKNQHSALSAALKRGKEVADVEVENALFKRAVGYTYEEVTREAATDPDTGDQVLTVTKVVTKEVQPDVTAQIFWLKNRRPDKWRDKWDINHSGSLEVNNPLQGLTTEELRKLIKDDS